MACAFSLSGCGAQTINHEQTSNNTEIDTDNKEIDGKEGVVLTDLIHDGSFQTALKEMFENDAFENAWYEFQVAIENVDLVNDVQPESKGSTSEEVDKMFSVKPETSKYLNGVLHYYHYTGEKVFVEETGEPSNASIVAYFEKDQLLYMGIANSTVMFYPNKFMTKEKAKSLEKNESFVKDLFKEKPIIMGMGVRIVNGKPLYILPVPTGEVENAWMDFYHILEGKVERIRSLSFSATLENFHTSLISAYANYINEFGTNVSTDYDNEVFFKLHPDKEIELEKGE